MLLKPPGNEHHRTERQASVTVTFWIELIQIPGTLWFAGLEGIIRFSHQVVRNLIKKFKLQKWKYRESLQLFVSGNDSFNIRPTQWPA